MVAVAPRARRRLRQANNPGTVLTFTFHSPTMLRVPRALSTAWGSGSRTAATGRHAAASGYRSPAAPHKGPTARRVRKESHADAAAARRLRLHHRVRGGQGVRPIV